MKSFRKISASIGQFIGPGLAPASQNSLADGAIRMDDRVESRWERREDAVENTVDGVQDRHEFREERRDRVGDGSDCRQVNRHDRAEDSVDWAQDRQDERAGRLNKRFDLVMHLDLVEPASVDSNDFRIERHFIREMAAHSVISHHGQRPLNRWI